MLALELVFGWEKNDISRKKKKEAFLPSSSNTSDTNPNRTVNVTSGLTKNRLVATVIAVAASAKFRPTSGTIETNTSKNIKR